MLCMKFAYRRRRRAGTAGYHEVWDAPASCDRAPSASACIASSRSARRCSLPSPLLKLLSLLLKLLEEGRLPALPRRLPLLSSAELCLGAVQLSAHCCCRILRGLLLRLYLPLQLSSLIRLLLALDGGRRQRAAAAAAATLEFLSLGKPYFIDHFVLRCYKRVVTRGRINSLIDCKSEMPVRSQVTR